MQLDGNGNGTLLPGAVNNGSTDNCSVALSVSPSTFTCSNVGFNTVILTATDPGGNIGQCSAAVNVVDLVAPVAVCQNVTLSLNAAGIGSITAAQVDGGSADNCANNGLGLAVFPNTFNCNDIQSLPITVTLTVTDGSGNISTCLATVTIPTTAICCNMPGQASYYNVNASQFGSINTSLRLNGTFTVGQSITISGTNTIIGMGANARIVVLPGNTLTINGATLQAACNEMWDGIYLIPGSPSGAIVMTASTMNDALNGIVSDNGAAFTLNGSTFQRNLYALQVRNYSGPLPHPGSVRGCEFLDGVLITPQPGGSNGQSAIRVQNVKGLTIGFPSSNVADENLFQNQGVPNGVVGLVRGIEATGSSVNVYHNRFVDIRLPLNASGPLGTNCAVYATGDNTAPTANTLNAGHATSNINLVLNRHGNTFTRCQDGVFVDRPMQVNVRGNTMTEMGNHGVFVRRLQNNTLQIARNTFTQSSLAIFVGNCLQTTGNVRQNTITGNSGQFRNGIRMDLISYAPLPVGGLQMQIRDNNLDLRGNGIFLNSCMNVNVQGNTVRVLRANGNDQVRGIFVGSCTRVRVANNPDIFSAGQGATNLNTAGIYVDRSFETMVLCNGIHDIARCAVFEGDCEPSDFLGNTMRNGVDGFVLLDGVIGPQGRAAGPGSPAYACENRWLGQTNSWRAQTYVITNLPQYQGSASQFLCRSNQIPTLNISTFPNFQMTPQSVGNGPIQPVNCSNTLTVGGTSGGIQNVAQNRLQGNNPLVKAAQFRRDEWAFTALLREPTLATSDSAIQLYESSQTGTSLASEAMANEEVFVPDSIAAIVNATAIQPLGASEVNHKLVLSLRMDDNALSPADLLDLQTIAAQCEAEGGKGVNIARGLLASEGLHIWEDPGCLGNAKSEQYLEKALAEATVGVRLWPNPTGGKVYLGSDRVQVAKLRVFDALGNVLLERETILGPNPVELDCGKWSQGMVMVTVDLPNGKRQSWRVAIQR